MYHTCSNTIHHIVQLFNVVNELDESMCVAWGRRSSQQPATFIRHDQLTVAVVSAKTLFVPMKCHATNESMQRPDGCSGQ